MKKNIVYDRVKLMAADCAAVAVEDMRDVDIRIDGTEYEVSFHTDFMSYIMYIDFSGEVLGFLSQPYDGCFSAYAELLETLLSA